MSSLPTTTAMLPMQTVCFCGVRKTLCNNLTYVTYVQPTLSQPRAAPTSVFDLHVSASSFAWWCIGPMRCSAPIYSASSQVDKIGVSCSATKTNDIIETAGFAPKRTVYNHHVRKKSSAAEPCSRDLSCHTALWSFGFICCEFVVKVNVNDEKVHVNVNDNVKLMLT